jgi:hypothetical protein
MPPSDNKTLAQKTLEYWNLSSAARGKPSPVPHPTIERVLSFTTTHLQVLNPARPLARVVGKMKWDAVEGGRKKKGAAATVTQLRRAR